MVSAGIAGHPSSPTGSGAVVVGATVVAGTLVDVAVGPVVVAVLRLVVGAGGDVVVDGSVAAGAADVGTNVDVVGSTVDVVGPALDDVTGDSIVLTVDVSLSPPHPAVISATVADKTLMDRVRRRNVAMASSRDWDCWRRECSRSHVIQTHPNDASAVDETLGPVLPSRPRSIPPQRQSAPNRAISCGCILRATGGNDLQPAP